MSSTTGGRYRSKEKKLQHVRGLPAGKTRNRNVTQCKSTGEEGWVFLAKKDWGGGTGRIKCREKYATGV